MKTALASFLVSSVLILLSVGIGGGGHGIVSFAFLACAPLPLSLGDFIFYASPFVWMAIGASAAMGRRWIFPTLIALHYLVGGIILVWHARDDRWLNLRIVKELLPWIVLWIVGYAAGQFALWKTYLNRRRAIEFLVRRTKGDIIG